jgi:hypothetical protein
MNFVQIDPTIIVKLAEQALKNRVAELKDIYAKTFGKYGSRGGPPVGGDVKLEIIPDSKVAQRSLEEATRLPNLLLKWLFKLLPEVVLEILLPKYRALRQPFPYQTIDESTLRILSNEDIGIIRGRILQGAIGAILQDTGKTVGFFSRTTKTIYIGASKAISLNTTPGPLAHELAHAYASEVWDQFIFAMGGRKMMDTDKLDEGMAIYIANKVNETWSSRHPKEDIGDTGTGYDESYLDHAEEFIRRVGEDSALQAFFAGKIGWSKAERDKPEDTLRIGQKNKSFKWPWRQ